MIFLLYLVNRPIFIHTFISAKTELIIDGEVVSSGVVGYARVLARDPPICLLDILF